MAKKELPSEAALLLDLEYWSKLSLQDMRFYKGLSDALDDLGKARTTCEFCLKVVKCVDGMLVSHERYICTGSHLEVKTCNGSGKKLKGK